MLGVYETGESHGHYRHKTKADFMEINLVP